MINLNDKLREKLAELCHKQWSGWMEYLFSKCEGDLDIPDGDRIMIIPDWAVCR